MSEPTRPDDEQQRRLEEAMAEYLIAADAGRPPEAEAFLARYPDLRAELVAFLADLSALARPGRAAALGGGMLAGARRLRPSRRRPCRCPARMDNAGAGRQ